MALNVITGSFTATGVSPSFSPLGSYPPAPPRDFNVSIWGSFTGSIQLERSFDNGSTWLPITAAGTQLYIWTAPASEVAEEPEQGPIYRLHCTAQSGGTANYRISQ